MIIGIDFDNTIVCYDQLFYRAAVEQGLIPAQVNSNKSDVRDYLRKIGQEDAWTELQGEVYGVYIQYASAYPGVSDFFKFCQVNKIAVSIISHKTQYPFIGKKYDLPQAAYRWLEGANFSSMMEKFSSNVFFEPTKECKINRIKSERCTHFIDDLPEFLEEESFPKSVRRLLFDPNDIYKAMHHVQKCSSWQDLKEVIRSEMAHV